MITITRYVFQGECFSAVKFAMGYEKNMSFLVIPKSAKVKQIGLGTCKAEAVTITSSL